LSEPRSTLLLDLRDDPHERAAANAAARFFVRCNANMVTCADVVGCANHRCTIVPDAQLRAFGRAVFLL
jgi:hypothetical protein